MQRPSRTLLASSLNRSALHRPTCAPRRWLTGPVSSAPTSESAPPSPAVSSSPSSDSPALPWFVDPAYTVRSAPPHLPARPITGTAPPIPADAPAAVRTLHAALLGSPYLEPAALLVTRPPPSPPGPPLPQAMPRGRRKRGGTELGEGVEGMRGVPESGGIWSWVVLAQVSCAHFLPTRLCLCLLCPQVKEGTEKRGAIESVIRQVRQTVRSLLPDHSPPKLTLCVVA
jgi:hypothetical protein